MIERYRAQVSVYKRKLKSGIVYYARFWQGSAWSSGVNTGQTNKAAALAWAAIALEQNKPETPTLRQYTKTFFDRSGAYVKGRAFESTRVVPDQTLKDHQNRLTRHLLPVLGDIALSDLTSAMLANLQTDLAMTVSTQTVAHIVNTLSVILRHAAESGVIKALPVFRRLAVSHEDRGTFTVDEARRILAAPWRDPAHRLLNLLAAYTGMRQAELLGLSWSAIHADHIEVFCTWSEQEKRLRGSREKPSTKGGRSRLVPLPSAAARELFEFRTMSRFQTDADLVFSIEPGRPIKNWSVIDSLVAVLAQVGISPDERKRRHLDFHSWRHFYNSILISGRIPLLKVQSVVGHTSDKMSANYYHAEDYIDVQALIDSALSVE